MAPGLAYGFDLEHLVSTLEQWSASNAQFNRTGASAATACHAFLYTHC